MGGSPAHRLGGRDQAFGPPRVLGIKFLLRGCPLVVTGGQGGPVKDVTGGTPDPQRRALLPSPSHRAVGGGFSRGSQARCRPCHQSAHFRGLTPKRSPGGNLKSRGDLGQRGLWGQAPCRNLSSMAELCGLPTEGAPPGPARDAPSHQQPSSPCHSPQSPSAGWWTLSPGAGWPAKIKTQVTLGRPCQVQSPPSLGLSRPLTFIKSVQELRILGGAGGTGNERKGSALWPRKPWGARELGLASIGGVHSASSQPFFLEG